MSKNKKNSKKISLIVIAVIVFFLGLITYLYSDITSYKNLIFKGVTVGGVDLSGKTKNEALDLLKKGHDNAIKNNKITIKVKAKSYNIRYSDLQPRCNYDELLDKVYAYGREENFIKKLYTIKFGKNKEFEFNFDYDDEPIKKLISEIEKEINKEPEDAAIKNLKSGDLSIIPEKNGEKLLSAKLSNQIRENIKKENLKSFKLEAPVEVRKPKITKEKLKNIDSLITSFSTSYGTSSYERATNIKIATASINGYVLMPGEVFSFNEVVGKRTAEKGYESAGVIIGNKLESGLGGGVCQVSSTLYNAVLNAGLNSVERVHHTFPSSYVKMGRDATVDYGNIDYKFKNSFNHPIYIEGHAGGGVINFNIYGSKDLKSQTYTIESEVYKTIEVTTDFKDDPNLEVGKTEQVQKPHKGFKVKVYRSKYVNGEFISKEVISDDYYKPVNEVVKRGTKKIEETDLDNKEKSDKEKLDEKNKTDKTDENMKKEENKDKAEEENKKTDDVEYNSNKTKKE
ncbi:VanW family protein [Haloimpatiens sp. FM7315]|uniref:VanW family protein n=1 Tax=Haloimpatiens sp. FM7315 TaxID=3298609 RepID=UPI0035A2ACE8